MNKDELMKAVTEVDDGMIEEAGRPYKKRSLWPAAAAVAAMLALALLLPPALRSRRQVQPTQEASGQEAENQTWETQTVQPTKSTDMQEVKNTAEETPAGTTAAPAETTPAETASAPKQDDAAAKYLLASPVYPEQWPREENYKNHAPGEVDPLYARRAWARDAEGPYRAFLGKLIDLSLNGETEENAVMSPINLFLSLTMLSEITDGGTRAEFLNALGAPDQETVREAAEKIWNLVYFDDGKEKMIPANSLWLSDELEYRKDTVDLLAEKYYASVFRGTMGTETYDQALRSWINAQTGDLLKEQAEGLSMDAETRLGLVSTVFYQSKWAVPFRASDNRTAVFHGTGGDKETEFMYQKMETATYYYSEKFSFIRLSTMNGMVWFFLPDEGVSVQEMMAEETFQGIVSGKYNVDHYYLDDVMETMEKDGIGACYIKVNLTVPKMDISRKLDLHPLMKKLDIQTCFDPLAADFSPILGEDTGFLSGGEQATRIVMDEEGVSAASYVDWLVGAAPPPEEEIDFTLDRPFFFMISSPACLPYFAGIMNNP